MKVASIAIIMKLIHLVKLLKKSLYVNGNAKGYCWNFQEDPIT